MKLLAILMSALLAFATPTPVATETLSGVVSEYAEGEFMLLETADHGTVQVNLSETPTFSATRRSARATIWP